MRRVGLFVSCLIDQLYPHVGFHVVNVLERLGFEVVTPESQTCCGQPAFNSGYPDEARPVLESAFRCMNAADVEAFVVPSGSCTAMLRVFSREISAPDAIPALPIYEFCEFVDRFRNGQAAHSGRVNLSAVYHDSCHLLRGLGVEKPPRRLLRSIPGLELRELPEAVCCGFGGTFCVKMPQISQAMLEDKVHAIEASGAEAVVSADMGCLMHIASGLKARGSRIRAMHIAEVLDGAALA